jgi:hypothetical protein
MVVPMNSLVAILDALNQKYGLIASVLVKRGGQFLARAGDPREPSWNDPYNLFFRDAEAIANTFSFLEDQAPPRSLVQGTRHVMVFKPHDDVLLGAVKDDSRGTVEMYQLSEQINAELASLFSGVDLGVP